MCQLQLGCAGTDFRGAGLTMDIIASPLFPLLLAAPILLVTIVFDLRLMRIPDPISLALLAVFCATLPWAPDLSDLPTRLAVAAICFVLGFAAFAYGKIGGGDVKIFAVLMLFVPLQFISLFMLIFAACLMLGVALIVLTRFGFADPASRWKFLRSREFPMGISIAGAGLALPVMLLTGA
jgi:prepilin peptidase CpaA